MFSGLGLGAIAVQAKTITEGMCTAAANAVAEMVDSTKPGSALLPSEHKLKEVSFAVALAVAKAALQDGTASAQPDHIEQPLRELMWKPNYRRVTALS